MMNQSSQPQTYLAIHPRRGASYVKLLADVDALIENRESQPVQSVVDRANEIGEWFEGEIKKIGQPPTDWWYESGYDYGFYGQGAKNFDAHFPRVTAEEMAEAGKAFEAEMATRERKLHLEAALSSPVIPLETVAEIARDWNLIPNSKNLRRVNRALDLVRRDCVRFHHSSGPDDHYWVKSQFDNDKQYRVIVNGSAVCGCESFRNDYHDAASVCGTTSYCKHGDATLIANWLDLLSIPDEIESKRKAARSGRKEGIAAPVRRTSAPVVELDGRAVRVDGKLVGGLLFLNREDLYTHSSAGKCMVQYFETKEEAVKSLLKAEGYDEYISEI